MMGLLTTEDFFDSFFMFLHSSLKLKKWLTSTVELSTTENFFDIIYSLAWNSKNA